MCLLCVSFLILIWCIRCDSVASKDVCDPDDRCVFLQKQLGLDIYIYIYNSWNIFLRGMLRWLSLDSSVV